MSIGAKSSIVATVLTTALLPVWDSSGKEVGHKQKQGKTFHVRCVVGKPIPPTPLAKKLGINGKKCKKVIVRRVHVKHAARGPVVCKAPMFRFRGGCAVKGLG